MRKFRIPYIPYRSLLLSTTILNDKDLAVEEDVVEHSEMDDQSTTECEGLEKETPGESGDPTEVEEKENKGTQKCKKRKFIKHKVNLLNISYS